MFITWYLLKCHLFLFMTPLVYVLGNVDALQGSLYKHTCDFTNVEMLNAGKIFPSFEKCMSILICRKKSETCLYKGCKCCSWQFDFLSETSRSLFEIARSCMSAKQRISLKHLSVKIMILWNDKSIRTWNTEKHM